MKTTIKILSGLFGLSLLVFLAACAGKVDKKAELEKLKKQHMQIAEQIRQLEAELTSIDSTSVKLTDITATEMQPSEFNHYIEVQGTVDGEDNVAVSPQVPAIVTAIYVKEGASVKKGQVLAQLDDNVLKQQIAGLNQQLDFASNLYNKQKSLWEKKIGSEVQYLTAKNNMESLQKNIDAIKEQVEMYRIKSPINGTVEEVGLKVGQMAAAGMSPAFRVVNFSSAKIKANVAEVYAARIKPGNEVSVFFPDFKEEIITRIAFTSKYIDPTNRTFQVEIRLGPSKVEYRANMIAVVKIKDYSNKRAMVLPVNLIKESQSGKYVFVTRSESGKLVAAKKMVEIGQTYNGLAEIIKGLEPGDKVITSGYSSLVEGQSIRIN